MVTLNITKVKQFLGSEDNTTYEAAKVVILPIPYEATTTYRKGCQYGPEAVIEASDQLEVYDEELKKETCLDVGIYTHEAIADTRNNRSVKAEEMVEVTTKTVGKLIDDGKFVIGIGGEHSITSAVVKAYQQREREPFTVVQIDAHGDMRHEFEGSIYNHACVMRRILDMGLYSLPVGIRSICKEEALLIEEKQIPVIWDRDIRNQGKEWIQTALGKIPTKKVFITIDVDGLNPSLMPGVGTPEPGGLDWYELTGFFKQLFAFHQVIGCDVMELAPLGDSVVSEFTTAKLIYKLIGYQATTQGW